MIERLDVTPVGGATIFAAAKHYEKFPAGEESMPRQSADPRILLEKMTLEERESFVRDGSLPEWVSGPTDTKTGHDQDNAHEPQGPEPPTVQ